MTYFLRFCFLFILVTNCAPEYVNNTRILAKGFVVNGVGAPLVNRAVNITARNFQGISGNNQIGYLLGNNTTNNDGSFEVVALLVYDENIYISIDGGVGSVDYLYQTSIGNSLPLSLSFDLGTVTLRKKATVNYTISRASATGTSLTFSVLYQSPTCSEVFEDGILIPDASNCYSEIVRTGNLNDSNPSISRQFESTLGSTVVFSYSINGAPNLTESFVIDETSLNYEFNY